MTKTRLLPSIFFILFIILAGCDKETVMPDPLPPINTLDSLEREQARLDSILKAKADSINKIIEDSIFKAKQDSISLSELKSSLVNGIFINSWGGNTYSESYDLSFNEDFSGKYEYKYYYRGDSYNPEGYVADYFYISFMYTLALPNKMTIDITDDNGVSHESQWEFEIYSRYSIRMSYLSGDEYLKYELMKYLAGVPAEPNENI